ncbi:MAG: iron donor protein CyaY [Thiobacillaceae bacterium]|jgi:CyaY protein|nr:iron donor protein CyaY [Thiobacillaceae bacterium]
MEESEYGRLADAALRRIEEGLDRSEGDLDYQLAAGGVLEIEFEDGAKMVVNKQSAAQEIWVAARSGGFHYRWDGASWRDTRSGEELFAALERMLSDQAGAPIRLA